MTYPSSPKYPAFIKSVDYVDHGRIATSRSASEVGERVVCAAVDMGVQG
jgi:hypothetical protein